jgi:protein SDA1
MMMFVSRLISMHQLQLENFYPFIQRFLQPHQKNITQILALLCDSVHALVPPDTVLEVVRAIANAFVGEGRNSDCIIIGINSIR